VSTEIWSFHSNVVQRVKTQSCNPTLKLSDRKTKMVSCSALIPLT